MGADRGSPGPPPAPGRRARAHGGGRGRRALELPAEVDLPSRAADGVRQRHPGVLISVPGHAMAAGAVFGFLAFLAWRELRGRPRWVAIAGAVVAAVLIALTRPYLGVHYPSDVLAGLLAGVLWADLVVLAWRLGARRLANRPPAGQTALRRSAVGVNNGLGLLDRPNSGGGIALKRSTDRILTTHPAGCPTRRTTPRSWRRAARATSRFDELTQTAIQDMIRRQREIGIDILSDGEFWKVRDQRWYDDRCSGVWCGRSSPARRAQPAERASRRAHARVPRVLRNLRPDRATRPCPAVGRIRRPDMYQVITGPIQVTDGRRGAAAKSSAPETRSSPPARASRTSCFRCSARAGSGTALTTSTTTTATNTTMPWRRSSRTTTTR